MALLRLGFSRGVTGDESTLPLPRESGGGTPFYEPLTGARLDYAFLSGREDAAVAWEGEEAMADSAAYGAGDGTLGLL